ncbi:hypothetical protein Tco_0133319 [Tanacetum coccineum]
MSGSVPTMENSNVASRITYSETVDSPIDDENWGTTITDEEEKLMDEIEWGWVSQLKPPATDTITNQAPNAPNTNMNEVILNAPNKDKTIFEVDATVFEVHVDDPIHDVSHAKTELTIAVNTFVCPSSIAIAETEIDEIPDEVKEVAVDQHVELMQNEGSE